MENLNTNTLCSECASQLTDLYEFREYFAILFETDAQEDANPYSCKVCQSPGDIKLKNTERGLLVQDICGYEIQVSKSFKLFNFFYYNKQLIFLYLV